MRDRHPVHCLSSVITIALLAGAAVPAAAQSTAFTYQGSLDDGGAPAGGPHDFRFRLFNAASGGVQVGSPLCVDNVNVVEGGFTVQLDFGQQYATSEPRYLEIEVRRDTGLSCGNVTGLVLLAPRQQLTAAPIAAHASSAFSLDAPDGSPSSAVFVDNSGNVGIGTPAPRTALHVNGQSAWITGGNGGGLPAAAGAGLRLYDDGSRSNIFAWDYASNNPRTLTLQEPGGNVGIGTTTPAAKLDVRGDIRLGSNGQYSPMVGIENLQIVRGLISPGGTVQLGVGFSAERVAEGQYVVTFTTPFAGTPVVVATSAAGGAAPGPRFANISGFGPGNADIEVWTANGNRTDSFVTFCAVGPR